ncbi:UxaA family hydrolase [Ornithinimicrobium sp. LYQ121]|uniref:UxaA family hydrolase n=1 Tax=Ornithinimicrobium sp. LYQ121 TaxID=3378801 RepID=UPI00385368FA
MHDVPEGHRIAVAPIREGEVLSSWGRPFAVAVADLAPGDYVLSDRMLGVLHTRGVVGQFPEPNVVDHPLEPCTLDRTTFVPPEPEQAIADGRTFLGYDRGRGLGVGTRNHIVVVATSSRTGAFVQALEGRLRDIGRDGRAGAGIDPLVTVVHTEGGRRRLTHNRELVLRTLAGYAVHPNVGALLAVDEPDGGLGNDDLRAFLSANSYPSTGRPLTFFSRSRSVEEDLQDCERQVRAWVPEVAAERTERPLSDLTLALQCGGSDAFSGITANPLAGAVARQLVRRGGTAILAETDELVGAEQYVVSRARSADVAQQFLDTVARFTEQVGRHGHSAETNVAGGNLWRGLYNISIKSLGAARKLDPRLVLEHVVDYATALRDRRGYIFMDSPGNDLESIAGEVACGANIIFFTTGNGSVTNFPFVPTLKLVSTTGRYNLLPAEMDVDAGRLLTGESMDGLTEEVLDLSVAVSSGQRSAGERAGHSQVSLWREWSRGHGEPAAAPEEALSEPETTGRPLPVVGVPAPELVARLRDLEVPRDVGLVMPTSICSGQVAQRVARGLSESAGPVPSVAFAAPAHTEGCGASSGASEQIFARVVIGHARHPRVRHALMLEHGCEKTHNAYFREVMVEQGDADLAEHLGWASIQLDGGIDAVERKIRDWFVDPPVLEQAARPLVIGLHAVGPVPPGAARGMAQFAAALVRAGHAVVVVDGPQGLLRSTDFTDALLSSDPEPTLRHGEAPDEAGMHVMAGPGEDWLEAMTALAGAGAAAVLTHVDRLTVPGHPFVPVLQFSTDSYTVEARGRDLDLGLPHAAEGMAPSDVLALADLLAQAVQGQYEPAAARAGLTGFQVSRGGLGVSI